jgi:hypothetical protein
MTSYFKRLFSDLALLLDTIQSNVTTSTNKRKHQTFDDEDTSTINSPPCLSFSNSAEGEGHDLYTYLS